MKIVQNVEYEYSSDEEYMRKTAVRGKNKRKDRENKKVVESKIKFLIDKDKQNKFLEKKLKKQQNKLEELERKVEEQENARKKASDQRIRITSKDIFSLSEDSS